MLFQLLLPPSQRGTQYQKPMHLVSSLCRGLESVKTRWVAATKSTKKTGLPNDATTYRPCPTTLVQQSHPVVERQPQGSTWTPVDTCNEHCNAYGLRYSLSRRLSFYKAIQMHTVEKDLQPKFQEFANRPSLNEFSDSQNGQILFACTENDWITGVLFVEALWGHSFQVKLICITLGPNCLKCDNIHGAWLCKNASSTTPKVSKIYSFHSKTFAAYRDPELRLDKSFEK